VPGNLVFGVGRGREGWSLRGGFVAAAARPRKRMGAENSWYDNKRNALPISLCSRTFRFVSEHPKIYIYSSRWCINEHIIVY